MQIAGCRLNADCTGITVKGSFQDNSRLQLPCRMQVACSLQNEGRLLDECVGHLLVACRLQVAYWLNVNCSAVCKLRAD
jgi:hypothetical protein